MNEGVEGLSSDGALEGGDEEEALLVGELGKLGVGIETGLCVTERVFLPGRFASGDGS